MRRVSNRPATSPMQAPASVARRLEREAGFGWSRRRMFFESASVMATHLGDDVDGVTYIVSTRDRRSLRLFTKHRLKEWRTLEQALVHLDIAGLGTGARERLFLDVGANIGTPCIHAVSRHGFRQAIAFEAEPENFRILQANVAINGLGHKIQSYNLAVSQGCGVVELAIDPEWSGAHRIGCTCSGQSSIEVQAVALDEFLPEIGIEPTDVGLLWIDVEGHEPEVLRGASTLLARLVPIVLEVSHANLGLLPIVHSYSSFVDLRLDSQPLPLSKLPEVMEDRERRERSTTDVLLLP
jgi:FkbM family methyltransferase